MINVLLVGNPNCGKTTLFNALTGEHQRVGNWPGVTVERKIGSFKVEDQCLQVIDLPGTYSLTSTVDEASLDEQITAQTLACSAVDIIINVIDASHLERHLYLTSQLMELGKPLIIVLNMMDLAKRKGIEINVSTLANRLACPVIPFEAHRKKGLPDIKKLLLTSLSPAASPLDWPECIQEKISYLERNDLKLQGTNNYLALRVLEGDTLLLKTLNHPVPHLELSHGGESLDIILADARYSFLHDLVLDVQQKCFNIKEDITAKLDNIVLHRIFGLPIFFLVMYGLFFISIQLGGVFQHFFDGVSQAIFVDGTMALLQKWHAPDILCVLLAHGVGRGINTLSTFIPVLAAMFFCLSILEASGYMTRAAFVIDRVMRFLGLPGKAFIPLMIGFGCNVPAIQATRTLDFKKDRLLTMMMMPFMSCSARLAIYTTFVAVFFPGAQGSFIVFSLYIIGILLGMLTGFLLRKTVLQGECSPLLMELPAYHWPSLQMAVRETLRRVRDFLWRAAKVILPVCIVLGMLNALTVTEGIHLVHEGESSLLASLGQVLTPLFAPLGVRAENWPATVSLFSGVLAKEVVIGSLNTLYGALNHVLLNTPEESLSFSRMLLTYFDGAIGAYAYLLFILLYMPCVSTMAVLRQESHRRWMYLSMLWSFIVAYTVSVLFYQLATVYIHPWQTLQYVLLILALLFFFFGLFYRIFKQHIETRYATLSS